MGTYIINRAANIAGGLGGGVAAVIACSKKSVLDRFEEESTDPDTGQTFHAGSWFRLWSDGFCEQGILCMDYWGYTQSSEHGRLYLPLPYDNANYTVNITPDYTDSHDNFGDTGFACAARYKTYYNLVPSVGGDSGTSTTIKVSVTCAGFVSQETIANILAGKVWTAKAQSQSVVVPTWIDDPNV